MEFHQLICAARLQHDLPPAQPQPQEQTFIRSNISWWRTYTHRTHSFEMIRTRTGIGNTRCCGRFFLSRAELSISSRHAFLGSEHQGCLISRINMLGGFKTRGKIARGISG